MNRTIVYVRPALVTGGVLFADLEILSLYKKLGFQIQIITGEVFDVSAARHISENKYHLIVDPRFGELYMISKDDPSKGDEIAHRIIELIPQTQSCFFQINLLDSTKRLLSLPRA